MVELRVPASITRNALPLLVALLLAVLELFGAPRASNAGDFAGPLADAQLLLVGQDPLARPPANASSVPYPLTATTLILPLVWMPRPLLSALVAASAALASWLLVRALAPRAPYWAWLVLLLYVPLLFNLNLVQWAPPLLLATAVGLQWRHTKPSLQAGLCFMPLIAKAQLAPILAGPILVLLASERRWRVLLATLAGWAVLLGLSLLLRPGWPLVWWEYVQPFSSGYAAPAFDAPWLGLPLFALSAALALHAWMRRDAILLLGVLVLLISLIVPQRAIYEAAALLVPLATTLRVPRLGLAVVALSWALPLQPLLRIEPATITLLSLYVPLLVGLALASRVRT